MIWKRNCPKCNKKLKYKDKKTLKKATNKKSLCKSCAFSGENNPMYGRCVYDIWLEKYGKKEADKKRDSANKKRPDFIGKNNPMYGKCTYDVWLSKYGKEEANKRKKEKNKKISQANSGKNHPMYGRKRPDTIKRNKETCGKKHPSFGVPLSEKVKKILSEQRKGKGNPMYGVKNPGLAEMNRKNNGKNHPFFGKKRPELSGNLSPTKRPEVRKKQRIRRLKEIEKKHGQCVPNYNSDAILILENFAKKYNINDLMHAENGGEFYIKELGYWAQKY